MPAGVAAAVLQVADLVAAGELDHSQDGASSPRVLGQQHSKHVPRGSTLDTAPFLDEDAVHHGDLPDRPAEGVRPDARRDLQGLGQGYGQRRFGGRRGRSFSSARPEG